MGKFFQGTAAEDKSWRVCLIDTADDLNRNSENAILKLLEEPPARALIILLSSSPGRLLPTIRSRCMHSIWRATDTQIVKIRTLMQVRSWLLMVMILILICGVSWFACFLKIKVLKELGDGLKSLRRESEITWRFSVSVKN